MSSQSNKSHDSWYFDLSLSDRLIETPPGRPLQKLVIDKVLPITERVSASTNLDFMLASGLVKRPLIRGYCEEASNLEHYKHLLVHANLTYLWYMACEPLIFTPLDGTLQSLYTATTQALSSNAEQKDTVSQDTPVHSALNVLLRVQIAIVEILTIVTNESRSEDGAHEKRMSDAHKLWKNTMSALDSAEFDFQVTNQQFVEDIRVLLECAGATVLLRSGETGEAERRFKSVCSRLDQAGGSSTKPDWTGLCALALWIHAIAEYPRGDKGRRRTLCRNVGEMVLGVTESNEQVPLGIKISFLRSIASVFNRALEWRHGLLWERRAYKAAIATDHPSVSGILNDIRNCLSSGRLSPGRDEFEELLKVKVEESDPTMVMGKAQLARTFGDQRKALELNELARKLLLAQLEDLETDPPKVESRRRGWYFLKLDLGITQIHTSRINEARQTFWELLQALELSHGDEERRAELHLPLEENNFHSVDAAIAQVLAHYTQCAVLLGSKRDLFMISNAFRSLDFEKLWTSADAKSTVLYTADRLLWFLAEHHSVNSAITLVAPLVKRLKSSRPIYKVSIAYYASLLTSLGILAERATEEQIRMNFGPCDSDFSTESIELAWQLISKIADGDTMWVPNMMQIAAQLIRLPTWQNRRAEVEAKLRQHVDFLPKDTLAAHREAVESGLSRFYVYCLEAEMSRPDGSPEEVLKILSNLFARKASFLMSVKGRRLVDTEYQQLTARHNPQREKFDGDWSVENQCDTLSGAELPGMSDTLDAVRNVGGEQLAEIERMNESLVRHIQDGLSSNSALLLIFDISSAVILADGRGISGALILRRTDGQREQLPEASILDSFVRKLRHSGRDKDSSCVTDHVLAASWCPLGNLSIVGNLVQDFEWAVVHSRQAMFRRDPGFSFDCPEYSTHEVSPVYWDSVESSMRAIWGGFSESLTGIDDLTIITHGRVAQMLPWETGMPMHIRNIKRFPGLYLYGSSRLKSQPSHDLELSIHDKPREVAVMAYSGTEQPLPFAEIEAQIVCELWGECATRKLDLDAINSGPRWLHFAGHGSDAADSAESGLLLGDGDHLGQEKAKVIGSRCSQVILSCCLSGRTVDLFGEQRGVVAKLLQGGSKSVIASTASLHDGWGMALSVIVHVLITRGPEVSLRSALRDAKLMISGKEAWDDVARRRVVQGWSLRLRSIITDFLSRLRSYSRLYAQMPGAESEYGVAIAREAAEIHSIVEQELGELFDGEVLSHCTIQLNGHSASLTWFDGLLLAAKSFALSDDRSGEEDDLDELCEQFVFAFQPAWRWTPDSLILGSLTHMVQAFGE